MGQASETFKEPSPSACETGRCGWLMGGCSRRGWGMGGEGA